MPDQDTEDSPFTITETPQEVVVDIGFDQAMPVYDTLSDNTQILAPGQRTQTTTSLVGHAPRAMPDPSQQTDLLKESLLTGVGAIQERQAAAKAVFNSKFLDNLLVRQVLPFDPWRKIARLWVTVAQPVLLGPEQSLNNYINVGTLTPAQVVGCIYVPGVISPVFVLEYTGQSELWALAASGTASSISYVNETYGGQAIVG